MEWFIELYDETKTKENIFQQYYTTHFSTSYTYIFKYTWNGKKFRNLQDLTIIVMKNAQIIFMILKIIFIIILLYKIIFIIVCLKKMTFIIILLYSLLY